MIYLLLRQTCLVALALANMELPYYLGIDANEYIIPYFLWCVVSVLFFVKIFPLEAKVLKDKSDR